ncbi:MAG: hypothetical protein LUD01_08280 [Clostridiales bacterium]|nr:hypothetical protein [Clostridiales bacterium]
MKNHRENDNPAGTNTRGGQKKIGVVVLALVILILLAALIYLVVTDRNPETGESGNAYVDMEADEWDDGIEDTTDTADNMVIPGYSGAQMTAGDTVLQLSIGNPEENTCYLQATLELEDGTVLYESGLLEPGTGYEQIELVQTLEEGTYEAVVHYQGYSMEEEPKELNGCDSALTLTVLP